MRIKGQSHFVEETRKHRIAAISRDRAKPGGSSSRKQGTPLEEKDIKRDSKRREYSEQVDLGFAAI